MDRKERISAFFASKHYIPMTFDELCVMLDVPTDERDDFNALLDELAGDGLILVGKKGRYVPCNGRFQKYTGVLSCNASGKFGFVICDSGNDIYVSAKDMGNALNGDKVLLKHKCVRNGKTEGSVVKVLERANDDLVGVIYSKHKNIFEFRCDDRKFYPTVYIREAVAGGAKVGERVLVSSVSVMQNGRVYASVKAVLGDSDDLVSLVESIVIQNKIKIKFDDETLIEAENISDEVTVQSDRLDLRDKTIFTIDGVSARDFDDAVSIEKTDGGNYLLGVHIADVSEYVKEKSYLDKEAYERGTSVYLPNKVIPMLPEKLSNGICSLNPNVDRLTLSVFMEINSSGEVVSNSISKSVIRSKERLTYEDMNRLLDGGDVKLKEKYLHIYDDLKNMVKLAEILRTKRKSKGSVNFDFNEAEIITDDSGIPIKIEIAQRGISNKMIEEFMLIANETVAEFAYWSEIPIIYRVHKPPSTEKLNSFISFIKPFGLTLKGKIDSDNPVNPKAFEQILEKVKGTPLEMIISRTMLRSLMKAEYKAENLGHFGLASKYYCHFTSPIRRYPDLIVHRNLKRFLSGDKTNLTGFIERAAKHSSERECSAEYCERDSDDLMKAYYLKEHIGEEFSGVVSGITNFGMFVQLENGIEGMIRLENMTDDYYSYIENTQVLLGEKYGREFKIGDSVNIMVVRCDLLSRNIDFVLSEHISRKILEKFNDKPFRRRKR